MKLKDYEKIWTKFCFLDESGSLDPKTDPFVTVGLIKCSQPYYLYSRLNYERNKRRFYDEMKFNKLSKNNIDFDKFAIDTFIDTRSILFYSYTVDKQGSYFQREFDGNPWNAYEQISIRLAESALSPSEILILLADHITTPKNILYEVNVKHKINQKAERLAMAGVCRFDSKGNDLIQVVDLFIGAINYDLKIATGLVTKGDKYKKDFVSHIKNKLGVSNFTDGFRDKKFNIFVDHDLKRRLT
ncbi:MAG: DUF3800 domain-containing protein [bacterium]